VTQTLNDAQGIADRLESLAERTAGVMIQDASAYDRVLQLFFSRGRRTFKGITTLAGDGLGEPAMILVRSLYEDTLNLLYIGTNPDELAELYLDYAHIRNFKYLKFIQEVDPEALAGEDQATLAEVEERFKILKERYPKINNWSGLTITDTARKVHMSQPHKTLYKIACDMTHGNVAGVYHFLLVNDNRPIGVEGEDNGELITTALILGLECFRTLMSEVNGHFELGQDEELLGLGDELGRIIRTEAPAPVVQSAPTAGGVYPLH
jgi:hypothetical protein